MDIIEKSSDKIFRETEENLNRKTEEKPFEPQEVADFLSNEVGKINPLQLSLPDIKGNAETGKETFEKIASSVSDSDRQKFRFYPPLTEEEKKEMEQKEPEENQNNPILEGLKINAITEIQNALNENPPINSSELTKENQNWEEEIKQSNKTNEVQNLKFRILADIQAIREKKQPSEETSSTNSYKLWIISGVVGAFLIGLVIWLWTRKKNR